MPIDAEDNSAGFSAAAPNNNGSTDVPVEVPPTGLSKCLPLEPVLMANSELDEAEEVTNTPSEKEEDISPSPTYHEEVARETMDQIARTTRKRQPPDSSIMTSHTTQESTNTPIFQATLRLEKKFIEKMKLAEDVILLLQIRLVEITLLI